MNGLSIEQKADFLQNDFVEKLRSIPTDTAPAWGKLSLQGMIEHMSDSFRNANGKELHDLMTEPAHVEKMQAFLRSDTPFKENTVNRKMGETPAPLRWDHVDDAIGELQAEIADFADVFDQDKSRTITNPFFGDLNWEDWVLLLYKHATHHLRQFGAV